MRARVCAAAMAVLLWGGAILPAYGQDAAAGQLYEKGATWQQTLLAARAKYLAWDEQRQAAASVTLGPWFSSGPLKAAAFTEALFPEQGLALDAKTPDGKMLWHKFA